MFLPVHQQIHHVVLHHETILCLGQIQLELQGFGNVLQQDVRHMTEIFVEQVVVPDNVSQSEGLVFDLNRFVEYVFIPEPVHGVRRERHDLFTEANLQQLVELIFIEVLPFNVDLLQVIDQGEDR